MNGRNGPTFGEMPNTQEGGLDIQTRLRINLLEAKFGRKRREPKKERDTNMESFHIRYPSFLNLFTEVKVYDFEPLAKGGILLGIVIHFEGWPIYTKANFC